MLQWVKTRDREAFVMSRRLIRSEGLLCGGSSGTAMAAAVQAARSLKKGQRCVVILPDSVRNYMTKFLADEWMYEHGFIDQPPDAQATSEEDWCVHKQALVLLVFVLLSFHCLRLCVWGGDGCVCVCVCVCAHGRSAVLPAMHAAWGRWTPLPVTSLPQKFPLTVLPSVTCGETIDILHREGFDQMPVVGEDGLVRGRRGREGKGHV